MGDIEDAGKQATSEKLRLLVEHACAMPTGAWPKTYKEVDLVFRKLRKLFRVCPSKYQLAKKIKEMGVTPPPWLKNYIVIHRERSSCGYFVVSVALPPDNPDQESCEFDCKFCPDLEKHGYKDGDGNVKKMKMTRSYHDTEDTIARALGVDWDIVEQVRVRLQMAKDMNHPYQKIAIRILGGTFSPKSGTSIAAVKRKAQRKAEFQKKFVAQIYFACNTFIYSREQVFGLEIEKHINETLRNGPRIVEMSIETRPDTLLDFSEILRLRTLGITLVEIGVQHTNDELLEVSNRGHGVRESKLAIRNCKMVGMKIQIFAMLDLPGGPIHASNVYELDREFILELASNPDLSVDNYKLYITVLADGTPHLAKMIENGQWKRYSHWRNGKYIIQNCALFMTVIKRYNRVQRLFRDFRDKKHIPDTTGYEGELPSNFRQTVENEIKRTGGKILEIRERQVRSRTGGNPDDTDIKIEKYEASEGTEVFIECVDENDMCYGFVRLRKNGQDLLDVPGFAENFPELALPNTWLIRELKVHGVAKNIGEAGDESAVQHRGIGHRLMTEAQNYVRQNSQTDAHIAIISGVGARQYFELKHGYLLEGNGEYMVKTVTPVQPEKREESPIAEIFWKLFWLTFITVYIFRIF